MNDPSAADRILALERQALDRWSQGDTLGYVETYADDVSYFDDIGAHRRVDGIDAVRRYMSALQGQFPPHDYELVDPRVQVHGDTAVFTTRYHGSTDDGPLPAWKATSVYRRAAGEWRVVHAHWSLVKE